MPGRYENWTAAEKAVVDRAYGQRKRCIGPCGRRRVVKMFRLLVTGYLQGRCLDCERAYEAERWHKRSAASKAEAGGSALRRRRGRPRAKAA